MEISLAVDPHCCWHLAPGVKELEGGTGTATPLLLDRGCSNPCTAVSKLICPDSPFQAVNENYLGEHCKNAAVV